MSFDLERARAQNGRLNCHSGGFSPDQMYEALDEIELLRADLADSEKRNVDLRKAVEDLSATIFSGAQATRIEELEAALEYAISALEQCESEPEDALVIRLLRAMLEEAGL